ncbi:MAG TPA: hypothetical protein VFO93_06215 [Hymenobacter sp.]|uniref:DUF6896 domain-containing protein n=1 Tax=Hymenobacter sp. TaxID=1898978 RepID=UPI002D8080E9|nr:hypothetical protein [Hymenobacter sp.]HET9503114.1 hypothetical protein [Hymenobacter sp.]
MEQSLKEELINWIELLQSRCFELNTALIKVNKLDEKAELAAWDSFSCPARAVRLNLLPRTGNVINDSEAFEFTYHVHGTGITIKAAIGEVVHFEYFPQPAFGPRPVLGFGPVQQFISSLQPASALCDSHLLASLLEELFKDKKLVRIHETYFSFYLE